MSQGLETAINSFGVLLDEIEQTIKDVFRHKDCTIKINIDHSQEGGVERLTENSFKVYIIGMLKEVPNKNSGKTNKLSNIFLTRWYTIYTEGGRKDPMIIQEYGTRTYYCNNNSSGFNEEINCHGHKISTGVHFDGLSFEMKSLDDENKVRAHPIFHMQFDFTGTDALIIAGETHQIEALPGAEENRNIRIPTAQMDVFSALVVLFYDHLFSEININTFIGLVKKITALRENLKYELPTHFGNTPSELSPYLMYPIDSIVDDRIRELTPD